MKVRGQRSACTSTAANHEQRTRYNATLIGAGASLNFSGALYFHNSSYADLVELDGAGGSTTYAIGMIVVDRLTLSGSGIININVTGVTGSTRSEVGVFQ